MKHVDKIEVKFEFEFNNHQNYSEDFLEQVAFARVGDAKYFLEERGFRIVQGSLQIKVKNKEKLK